MRRIVLVVVSTISGLVMLFSYHTSTMGAGATAGPGTGASATPVDPGSASPAPSQSQATPKTTSGGSGGGGGSGTFTGGVVDTQWGPVQVQIKVSGGKIRRATAVVYPSGNGRDAEINSYALPVLAQEVIAAQSAHIDQVTGATVTSDGYIASLQSAIDKAHL
ncbi:MAG: FMN-binding protein [Actinomycetes bacterium]